MKTSDMTHLLSMFRSSMATALHCWKLNEYNREKSGRKKTPKENKQMRPFLFDTELDPIHRYSPIGGGITRVMRVSIWLLGRQFNARE